MKSIANASRDRLSPTKRLVMVAVGMVGIALLFAARQLEPDPRGYGTHEQLGLTPCYFQELTGHVCPTCGCTTAWAHALRGELSQAAQVNLGGMLLCVVVVIGAPWLLVSAVLGQWLISSPAIRPMLIVGSVWLAVVVLDWLRRITMGL